MEICLIWENLTIAGSVVDKKTIAIIVAMVNLNFKILILLLTFEFKIVCKNGNCKCCR